MSESDPVTQKQFQEGLQRGFDRVIEVVAHEISTFRTEVNTRFASIDRRLDLMDKRLDRLSDSYNGLARWADGLERFLGSVTGTQAAQQAFIEDLAQRVARLEQQIQKPQ